MRHFVPIAEVDVEPALTEVEARPDLWNSITLRKGGPHVEMDDIWFRYNDHTKFGPETYSKMSEEHVPINYPAWHAMPAVRKIVLDVMRLVEGDMVGGVWITRIPPGGRIHKHADFGWHAKTFDKFYTSLISDPGAEFWSEVDGEKECLVPKAGECWLYNNLRPHWVENYSDRYRMTLISCIRTDMFNHFHGRA